jgi:deaminated glutathione amidase
MKIALIQMTSGIDPAQNAAHLGAQIAEAASNGAKIVFTPEMSGRIDSNRDRARATICSEADDPFLAAMILAAKQYDVHLHIGSTPVLSETGDGRFANRGVFIAPDGEINARYDKMHLYDVDLPSGESWRESSAYARGERAVVVQAGAVKIGLGICYDMRFPALFAAQAKAGAHILTMPSAFTVQTGEAHWHILLRARAIENACWVVAAAQTGTHEDGRKTYGHSLVVDPWGVVRLDMGQAPGIGYADIDMDQLNDVRTRIPVLAHRREIPPLDVVA